MAFSPENQFGTLTCFETLRTQLVELETDDEPSSQSLDSEEEYQCDEYHSEMFRILHSKKIMTILPRLKDLQNKIREQLNMDLDFSTIQENDSTGELEQPILIACKIQKEAFIVHKLVEYFLLNGASAKASDHNSTALHYVVQNGYPDVLILLLDTVSDKRYPIDIEQHDAKGRTALQLAALDAKFECFEVLVSRGAKLDGLSANGKTALHLACSKIGDTECENNAECENGESELKTSNRKQVVERLLEHNPDLFHVPTSHTCKDVPAMYPLHVAVYYENLEILELLIKYCLKSSRWDNKYRKGKPSKFSIFQQRTENDKGQGPLNLAAHFGKYEAVKILLKYAKNVEISETSVNFRQKKRVLTPLHNAIIGKRHNFRNYNPDNEDFMANNEESHDKRVLKIADSESNTKRDVTTDNETRIKIIRALCEAKADLSAKAGLGALTPLEFATNDTEFNVFVPVLREFEKIDYDRDSKNEILIPRRVNVHRVTS